MLRRLKHGGSFHKTRDEKPDKKWPFWQSNIWGKGIAGQVKFSTSQYEAEFLSKRHVRGIFLPSARSSRQNSQISGSAESLIILIAVFRRVLIFGCLRQFFIGGAKNLKKFLDRGNLTCLHTLSNHLFNMMVPWDNRGIVLPHQPGLLADLRVARLTVFARGQNSLQVHPSSGKPPLRISRIWSGDQK